MMISQWSASQFSLTVYESTGAVWADESFVICDSSFGVISEWSVTQFSLMFSESTGAVRAEDSFCHLWKQFP